MDASGGQPHSSFRGAEPRPVRAPRRSVELDSVFVVGSDAQDSELDIQTENGNFEEPLKPGICKGEDDPQLGAESGFWSTTDSIIDMPNNGLLVKHQADNLVANIRGRHARIAAAAPLRTRFQLAEILPIAPAAPALDFPLTTRAIGSSSRIRFTINGQTLADLLDWKPGLLATSLDGAWVVLCPDKSDLPLRRHDGRASYCEDNRIRLSRALTTKLELDLGDEVAIVVLPRHGAIALCNPKQFFNGAPLSLLTASADDIASQISKGTPL